MSSIVIEAEIRRLRRKLDEHTTAARHHRQEAYRCQMAIADAEEKRLQEAKAVETTADPPLNPFSWDANAK